MAFGIDDIIATGLKIIDKIIPDAEAKEAAKLELLKLQQTGDLAFLQADVQIATAQADINKTEAANTNLFISGWRPFIGWCCGGALGYHFIFQPLLAFIFSAFGHPVSLPDFDMSTLSTILMGLLGLGSLRSLEKIKGVA